MTQVMQRRVESVMFNRMRFNGVPVPRCGRGCGRQAVFMDLCAEDAGALVEGQDARASTEHYLD